MMNTRTPSAIPSRRQQRGVVLFIALIVLVAMSLAGIAMIRSVDTTLGVAGNMAFKQATIQGSDRGVKAGYDWLAANSAGVTLQNSNESVAYFSNRAESNWFDLANWTDAICINGCGEDAAGNTIRYMIHRMCTEANTPYNGSNAGVANQCALNFPVAGGSTGGSMAVDASQFEGIPQLYYRITTRVDGPRNTVSIIQVSVLIQV